MILALVLFATAEIENYIRLHELAARIQYVQQTRGKSRVRIGETPAQTARLLGVDEALLVDPWGNPYRIDVDPNGYRVSGKDAAIANGTVEGTLPNDDSLAAAQAKLARYSDPMQINADAARSTIEAMLRMQQEIIEKRGTSGGDDGWGTPFMVEVDLDGSRYRVVSAGADRVFDPTSWNRPIDNDPASDMVIENGQFRRRFNVDRYLQLR
jgi:hypothetical protein